MQGLTWSASWAIQPALPGPVPPPCPPSQTPHWKGPGPLRTGPPALLKGLALQVPVKAPCLGGCAHLVRCWLDGYALNMQAQATAKPPARASGPRRQDMQDPGSRTPVQGQTTPLQGPLSPEVFWLLRALATLPAALIPHTQAASVLVLCYFICSFQSEATIMGI